MKLNPYVPSINISQPVANNLVELYHEMINVHEKRLRFDQNDCEVCVIGNAIRSGLFDIDKEEPKLHTFPAIDAFHQATDRIGLPICSTVGTFLFGNTSDIHFKQHILVLPLGTEDCDSYNLTSLDACVRIAAVLDRAGYDVSELPDIPQ